MQTIILSTLLIALFAFFYGRQQAQLYWPFRELNYNQFAKDKREELSEKAHACGLIICLLLSMGMAVLETLQHPVLQPWWVTCFKLTLHFVSLWVTFSMVFDPSFAIAYGQPWYYLGETAESDKKIKQFFGKHEGKTKFIGCLIIVAISLTAIKIFL